MRRYQQTYTPITEEQQQGYDWGGKPFWPCSGFLRDGKDQAWLNNLRGGYNDGQFSWYLLFGQDESYKSNTQQYTDLFDSYMLSNLRMGNGRYYCSRWGHSVVNAYLTSNWNLGKFTPTIIYREYDHNHGPSLINNGTTHDSDPMPDYYPGDPGVKNVKMQVFYRIDIYNRYQDNYAGFYFVNGRNYINEQLTLLYGDTPQQDIKQNITNRNLHGWYGTGGTVTPTGGRIPYLDGRIEKAQHLELSYNTQVHYYVPAYLPNFTNSSNINVPYAEGTRAVDSLRVDWYHAGISMDSPYTDFIHGDVVLAMSILMPWSVRNTSLTDIIGSPANSYTCQMNIIGVLIPNNCPGLPKKDITPY